MRACLMRGGSSPGGVKHGPLRRPPRRIPVSPLQRPEEIENVLLLVLAEAVEVLDDFACLGRVEQAPALVRPDRLQQIRGSPIVQEEQALPQPPQRRGSELPRTCLPLGHPVGEPRAHVVNEQVGVEIHSLVAQRGDRRVASPERGRMAERAPDGAEELPPALDGSRPAR